MSTDANYFIGSYVKTKLFMIYYSENESQETFAIGMISFALTKALTFAALTINAYGHEII